MLLPSDRLLRGDREVWARLHRADVILAQHPSWPARQDRALAEIARFDAAGPCYAGVSWGKDSVVLAHLIELYAQRNGRRLPLVWVSVLGAGNPDCPRVRDAFLAEHDVDYHEITVEIDLDEDGRRVGKGMLARGFALAAERWGRRYVSGVRADESGARKARMRHWGACSDNTCAPIGWWKTPEIFAYLERHNLPVHPAYAMTYAGTYDRNRLRVATIGGERGTEFGRRQHERLYYLDVLRAIGEER